MADQPQIVTDAQEKLLGRVAAWKPQETAPTYLTGKLPGDYGCDPLCLVALAKPSFDTLSNTELQTTAGRLAAVRKMAPEAVAQNVEWMREAEVKHSRLAMLAVVGWPLAELINPLSLQGTDGRVPSLFNGGLGAYTPFLILAAGLAAYLEKQTVENVNQAWSTKPREYIQGDLGFDPVGFFKGQGAYAQNELRTGELINGRLAMLAITGFAVQEFLSGEPVIMQTPIFFGL
eukprot:CAMPEP_0174728238 /NCGR_PEP_ID=MMETSP1094-20130205/51363_1 /TAXON_ID=156173 /ORGANISM="Chrysochromulina brevifilum, Strain UTEX LB 985" /LENGTH=231 /DNA_ID=CAMNT_0015930121 /DNA_START=83 /DNA_END=778 /DNA_ORIENTATION=+